MDPDNQPARRVRHLRVPVRPDEEQAIKALAAQAGVKVAAYLRQVGQGYTLRSMLDHKIVEELARIQGDLEQLGSQVDQWGPRDGQPDNAGPASVDALQSRIGDTQRALQRVMRRIVLPRSK